MTAQGTKLLMVTKEKFTNKPKHKNFKLTVAFDGLLDTLPNYSWLLNSPNFPEPYPDNSDLTWEVRTEMDGYTIQVEVLSFAVSLKLPITAKYIPKIVLNNVNLICVNKGKALMHALCYN